MDSKPLLLPTKTNANNAIEASKAVGRQKITSAEELANFSVRNCANCVKGREIMQPVSPAMTCNQALTKCLLLVFFGETCSRRSDFGNGAKRCEQGTTTRPLTLLHTPLSERDRLFSVQSLGPSHATLPVHTRYVTSARVAGGGKIKGQVKGHKM